MTMQKPLLEIGDIAIFKKSAYLGVEGSGPAGMITVRRALYMNDQWYYSNMESTSIYEEWYCEADIMQ